MTRVVALFDLSGHSVRPWALAGAECFCLDLNEYILPRPREIFASGGSITYLRWDAKRPGAMAEVRSLRPSFLISMAPCTDLTVAGAKHFDGKWDENSEFWLDAMGMVRIAPDLANELAIPWMFENPVGMISRFWRKPDEYFDPCDYGGYLPPYDSHPEWPDYIPPRDGYTKKTGIWAGNGFIMPGQLRTRVEVFTDAAGRRFNRQTAKLGGKSLKTKQIRSLSPRGFFTAVAEANAPLLRLSISPPPWRHDDHSIHYRSAPRMIL